MADHLKPTITSTYSNFVTEMDARFDDLAVGLDPAVTSATNVPVNSTRWSSASNKWQKYNGSAWNDLASIYAISISGNAGTVTNGVYTTGSYSNPSFITSLAGSKVTGDIGGNAGTATALQTARNINGVPFNGTSAISINLNNSLTINNLGTGSASGSIFNGSISRTISYNTIGAPSTSGANATGTWAIDITGNAATADIASDVTNAVLSKIYPIGSIYINAGVATNPAILLGFGTWVAFGAGRVMVGLNGSDPLFNTLEAMGGSKNAVLPSHNHYGQTGGNTTSHTHTFQLGRDFAATKPESTGFGFGPYGLTQGATGYTDTVTTGFDLAGHQHDFTTSTSGTDSTNGNLQPYITVAMWKRTA